MILIRQLAGVFSGVGFARKRGRYPTADDCGYVEGPVDLLCSPQNGTILAIGRSGTLPVPAEARVIDGSDCVATAGFIDSHTHALFGGDRSAEFFRRWSGAGYAAIAAEGGGIHRTVQDTMVASDTDLEELLMTRIRAVRLQGVSTVEVKTGYGGVPEGELRLLRLLTRIRDRLTVEGTTLKRTWLGLHALPLGCSEHDYCDAMLDILSIVTREGLADYADAFPEEGFFSLVSARRFLQAVRRGGIEARLHADELTNVGAAKLAAEIGALSADHLEKVNAAGLAALAAADTVATLLPATAFYLGIADAPARRLLSAGVRVALASDYNPGTSPRWDFGLVLLLGAAQLKMSPAELLCAVTYNAAAALGMEESVGVIAEGWRADIALWYRPPTGSFSTVMESLLLNGERPLAMVHGGRWCASGTGAREEHGGQAS